MPAFAERKGDVHVGMTYREWLVGQSLAGMGAEWPDATAVEHAITRADLAIEKMSRGGRS